MSGENYPSLVRNAPETNVYEYVDERLPQVQVPAKNEWNSVLSPGYYNETDTENISVITRLWRSAIRILEHTVADFLLFLSFIAVFQFSLIGKAVKWLKSEPTVKDENITEKDTNNSSEPQSANIQMPIFNDAIEENITASSSMLANISEEKDNVRKRGKRGGKKKKKSTLSEANDSTENKLSEPDNTIVKDEDITSVSNEQPTKPSPLSLTTTILGHGSHGTVVFVGHLDGKEVAVKRTLLEFYDLSNREIKLLQSCDDHINVVRYWFNFVEGKFRYIVMEKGDCSLAEFINKQYDDQEVLRQVTSGIIHLHSLNIVHRDIKPQNVLVTSKSGQNRMLISDFGLSKKLEWDQSSFAQSTTANSGTTGWRAPEILKGTGKMSTKIDIFSLGCLFYFVLTHGGHPFGEKYMRDANILNGKVNLSQIPPGEARSLIEWMLNSNPKERPTAKQVLNHPYFWNSERRLDFLLKSSDRFEIEPRDPPSKLLMSLEKETAQVVLKSNWHELVGEDFMASMGKYRKYNGLKVLDLLRALRNKSHHYDELPKSVIKLMDNDYPNGFWRFFEDRFPMLLISVWKFGRILKHENIFKGFYEEP